MLKKYLKRKVIKGIALIGPQNWTFRANQLLVLMYHRVLPRKFSEISIVQPGMAVYEDTFNMHMKVLARKYTFVRLEDWLLKLNMGEALPRHACAITFDDGWLDNYEYAFPALQEYGIPATIFIVSNKVGATHAFWPEQLARMLWREGRGIDKKIWKEEKFNWLKIVSGPEYNPIAPTRKGLDLVIERVKSTYSEQEIINLIEQHHNLSRPVNRNSHRDLMNWSEIREMLSTGLIDIGSHTSNHIRLKEGLDQKTLYEQIVGSKKIIQKNIGVNPKIFCYPNGDHSLEAEKLIKDNYIGAVMTRRGWNDHKIDPYRIKRVGIHQGISESPDQFIARLSGWL